VSNNKRIAKNTLMLYLRMLLIMIVSLFTVRIVLNTLGVEDYGIYNLVGGIVTSFAFLSSTMASATQRFFAFELGAKNYGRLNNIFNLTVVIYVAIAIVILILAESLGVWFLNEKLVIPLHRVEAANWVYQFSIFSFVITVLTTPLEAIIMAREKMSFYAYVSVVEAILRVVIVYLLFLFGHDKLKVYAVLTFAVTFLLRILYYIYCRRNFSEVRFSLFWDRNLFLELLNFAGWNLFGALTVVSFNQGTSFVLNIFFGPVVNASRGIATQVNNAVASFSTNFYAAVRPQIIKNYAAEEREKMLNLVFRSTKYSFFLLMLLSIPILLFPDFILKSWLKVVPEHAERFVQLTIWFNLINLLQIPISTAVQANGKIKKYQLITGFIMLLSLPLSYWGLSLGFQAEIVFYMMILVSLVALVFRLIILKQLISFRYSDYLSQVLSKIILVTGGTYGTSLAVLKVSSYYVSLSAVWSFLLFSIISCFISLLFIFYIGLIKDERDFVIHYVGGFLKNRINK